MLEFILFAKKLVEVIDVPDAETKLKPPTDKVPESIKLPSELRRLAEEKN